MSNFWSLWIIVLTVTNVVLILWLLFANNKKSLVDVKENEKTTGHEYDGIEEYDNPMPRWWFILFLLTIVFAVGYLIIFPGLGNYKGIVNWTSVGELRGQQTVAEKTYADIYGNYAQTPIAELARNRAAIKTGFHLFEENCAVCHGADGGGNKGYPNLIDNDWLYGGTPEKILETLTHGRVAAMPGWTAILGEKGIAQVTDYLLSFSAQENDMKPSSQKIAAGKKLYETNCVACHGLDAKGNRCTQFN
jgi:cytochrome c oxidase cbb3-type subunit III